MKIIQSEATFSPCRTWRYSLLRRWANGGDYAMFIGLNPSTADETQDDPTVRRCIRYAQSWGYSALYMTNIFAYRATDPKVMKGAFDPVGPDNDETLIRLAADAGIVVAAWGNHGTHHGRENVVRHFARFVKRLHVLKLTKGGHPCHPLYLKADLKPKRWE